MSKQIQGTSYWADLTQWWRNVAPPVRPSRADIRIYEKFLKRIIKNKKQPRILILGATPETRDLAAKYKAETTVCDISLEMIMAMTQLMTHKKASQKEIWVRASWVTVPLEHNYYDLILGDGVNTNVSWSEVNQWWKHLFQLLKPKGVFITRIFYITSQNEVNKAVNNVFKKIVKKKTLSSVDLGELKISLEALSYNPQAGVCTNAKYRELFFKHIKNFSVSPVKASRIYQKLIKIYPPKPVKVWRTPTKIQTEKEFKKYFKIMSGPLAPSFPSNTTIYLLAPYQFCH